MSAVLGANEVNELVDGHVAEVCLLVHHQQVLEHFLEGVLLALQIGRLACAHALLVQMPDVEGGLLEVLSALCFYVVFSGC